MVCKSWNFIRHLSSCICKPTKTFIFFFVILNKIQNWIMSLKRFHEKSSQHFGENLNEAICMYITSYLNYNQCYYWPLGLLSIHAVWSVSLWSSLHHLGERDMCITFRIYDMKQMYKNEMFELFWVPRQENREWEEIEYPFCLIFIVKYVLLSIFSLYLDTIKIDILYQKLPISTSLNERLPILLLLVLLRKGSNFKNVIFKI